MSQQTEFRALTLWRPWDQAILYGTKRLENRNWKPWKSIVGKLVALHAGQKYDSNGAKWMHEQGLYTPPKSSVSPTGIVGVARIVTALETSDDPWFVGDFGWLLQDVRAFNTPIPCIGAQGLWKVQGPVLEALQQALLEEPRELIEVDPRQKAFDFVGGAR